MRTSWLSLGLALWAAPADTNCDCARNGCVDIGPPLVDITVSAEALGYAIAPEDSVDIDGDARPLGGGPDLGADECVPD